jgi:RNA polymerase sigma-70 factor, ECF subfamily
VNENPDVTAEQAFDRYHEAVFRFAWRLTQRADAAEDITQETFLALVRAPGRFDASRGTVKNYLFAITRNLALKSFRDERETAPLDDACDPPSADPYAVSDIASAVAGAVAALPPLQREVLILFEYEGFTLEEIAGITGTETGTIKSRLHRARERLKHALAPYRPVGDPHGTV